MKIGGDFIIEGTATIENLPISNSSLSAIVQTDGNLFKRELGTISTASKESYIPGLSVAFPSIFNLNTESLDYNNRNLVVSLKNQLQGTVFMAPVSMNGTPQFRRMLKSDLTDASVLFSDDQRIANWDTAYSRGDFRTYGVGKYVSNILTLATLPSDTGFYFVNETTDIFDGVVGKQAKVIRVANSSHSGIKATLILGHNGNELGYRFNDTSPVARIWTDKNLLDYKEYGLGTKYTNVAEVTDISLNARFYRMLGVTGNPLGTGAYVNMPYQGGQTYMLKVHTNGMTVGSISSSSVITKHYDVWTSSSLSKLSQLTNDINFDGKYLAIGQGVNSGVTTFADANDLVNGFAWVSGDNKPKNRNSAVVSFMPFIRSEYGFQIAARQSDFFIRSKEAGVYNEWKEVWTTKNFSKDNYYTKNESLELFVGLNNTQTIGGTKTFSLSPVVPNATLNSHAINKGQVESWVNLQGYSTQTLTAGTNIQISASNVISATNTTYSAGTLALLNTGTDTSNRVWKTKDIADYVISKIAQGADSIWEHTPQGGLQIRDYDSLATRDGAIAISKGGGATKYNAIGIGTSINSDGNDGLVIGPFGVNLGTYGTVVGPYSVNTPMEGVVIGPFLHNNQRGCTVTGRYNHPILSDTNNAINDYSPLFIVGNGKSASIRSNAYVMFSDGKGEFSNVQSYKTQHEFADMDIPNVQWIRDNFNGGGSGNGSEDWVSNYGSGISVFSDEKARSELSNSDYGTGSGEILSGQTIIGVTEPTLVYLGNDGVWRKWNDTSNSEQLNVGNTAVLGILLGDNKSILLKGYYEGYISKELDVLVRGIEQNAMFHTFNKGNLLAHNATSGVERVFGYSISDRIAYFNPWMFKR